MAALSKREFLRASCVFTLSLRPLADSVPRFYARLPRLTALSRMQERLMDFVWIAAIAALWVVMAGAVFGLCKLDAPKGERR
jgi:hypothetical protein